MMQVGAYSSAIRAGVGATAAWLTFGLLTSGVLAQTKTWVGDESALWEVADNWSPSGVPTSSSDTSVELPAPVVVDGPSPAVTRNLTIGASGVVDIQGGNFAGLTVHGDQFSNDGQVLVNSNASAQGASVTIAGGATLGGGGSIRLFPGARLLHLGVATDQFTQGAEHTIRGEGLLWGNFVNEGVIVAEDLSSDGAGTLEIGTPPGGGGSVGPVRVNNGVIRSSASGQLSFAVQLQQGGMGKIIADAGTVRLNNSAIAGGAFESLNGGVFETIGNSLRLASVHNRSAIHMVSGNGGVPTMRLFGNGLTNDGTIVVQANDAPGGGSIVFNENGMLGGSGEVILNREGLGAAVRSEGAEVMGINGPQHTIRGVGTIDGTIVNEGTIIAEPRSGGTVLELNAVGAAMMTNKSLMRADPGGVLRLRFVRLTQQGENARIFANQGTVELHANSGVTPLITGGSLETLGTGRVEVTSNTRLHDVVNNGEFHIRDAMQLSLGGTHFTNNHTITLGGSAQIIVRENITLGGDGVIDIGPPAPTRTTFVRVETGMKAIHAAGHRIRGSGFINGAGSLGTFINNGRLEGATPSNGIVAFGTLGGSGLLRNVQISGTHAPGESTARVKLEGAYTIASFGGRLEMEIGGVAPGEGYDQLFSDDPTNVVTIGPTLTTLDLSLINGFLPANADVFTLIETIGSIQGKFATVNLPVLPEGYLWKNVSSPTSIAYQAFAPLAADFDGTNAVDAGDLVVWRQGFGMATGATRASGDADEDGDVDGDDFLVWQMQLGQVMTPPAGTTPEPSSLALLAAGLVISGVVRRRSDIHLVRQTHCV